MLIIGLAGVGAFVSVIAVGYPLLQRDNLASRLKSVAARRQELSAKQKAGFSQRSRFQPRAHVGVMKSVLSRLNLTDVLEAKELKLKLQQAGWRRSGTAVKFTFARIAAPIILFALALLYVSGPLAHLAGFSKTMICMLALVGGAYLPNMLLTNAIQKRQKVLSRAFPDALDLMVICVEAGVSIEAAFARVTEEMAVSAPEIAEEIGLTAAELAFLGERRQAYENLADRTGLPTVKSLATTLMQSEKYGTPVSLGLRVLSQENRDSRLSAAEKKAASLPAKLTVPMIIFFLPVLFLVIAGPAYIKITQGL